MRIKDFCIDNLYYEYAFSASLDEHVNIIVGNNGTFKTTLLRLLRHAIAYEKNGQFFQSHSSLGIPKFHWDTALATELRSRSVDCWRKPKLKTNKIINLQVSVPVRTY